MWQDALRVCKEYIPHKLSALQDEYEREMMDKSTRGAETLIQQVGYNLVQNSMLTTVVCYFFLRMNKLSLTLIISSL